MTFIRVNDEVEVLGESNTTPRKVLALEGDYATVEVLGRIKISRLLLSFLTAEHVARYMLSRKEDDIPAVITWLNQDPQNRRPQVVRGIHEIITNEMYMITILDRTSAKMYCWNNTVTVAEEIVDHLIQAVERA